MVNRSSFLFGISSNLCYLSKTTQTKVRVIKSHFKTFLLQGATLPKNKIMYIFSTINFSWQIAPRCALAA